MFYPLVAETSGHIHPTFDKLVKDLSNSIPIGDAKAFKRDMCFAVSVALQRGNARILKHAYERLEDSMTFGSRAWLG